MDSNDEVIDGNALKLSLAWAVLSFEWVDVFERLEPTWRDIFGQLGAIAILSAIAYAVLNKIMKSYDSYYLACHYDDRQRSVKARILIGAAVYVVGMLLFYTIGLGLSVIYSTVGLSAGLYKAYQIAKNSSQSE